MNPSQDPKCIFMALENSSIFMDNLSIEWMLMGGLPIINLAMLSVKQSMAFMVHALRGSSVTHKLIW